MMNSSGTNGVTPDMTRCCLLLENVNDLLAQLELKKVHYHPHVGTMTIQNFQLYTNLSDSVVMFCTLCLQVHS